MRIELDANGYVLNVFWGCYSGNCQEYTGTVPSGYIDLNDWSENALINAYYLDENGNLVLDPDKLAELEEKIEQDSIDNEPLLRKDLYGYTDALSKQYIQTTASGTVIAIDDVEKINPNVKIANIECYEHDKIDIITQGKNMLRNDAITKTISGITFTKLSNGGIRIKGTATANIEYNLSGSETNLTSLFALKKNKNYYLNIGGLNCEMKYYDGTTSQVYTGASGVINLTENKEVTQVLIKIPSGTTVNKTIYPMLEYGSAASEYENYKSRVLTIDFSELIGEGLFPSDDLYLSDDLYPEGDTVDYIYIEDSKIYISLNGTQKYLVKGNVNLFDGYDTVYTLQDTSLEMTYYIDSLVVEERIASIEVEQDSIRLEVSQTYSTKSETASAKQEAIDSANASTDTKLKNYSTTTQMKSEIKQTADAINLEVAKKVDDEDYTSAKIIAKINSDSSEAVIEADKISLEGKEINLTSDNVTIASENLVVNKNGSIKITDQGQYYTSFEIESELWENSITSQAMFIDDQDNNYRAIFGMLGVENNEKPTVYLTDYSSTTEINPYGIETPILTQTSLETAKKNFEKLKSGLDIIKNIDIYKYHLKSQADDEKKHIGFVIGDDYNYSKEVTSNNNTGVDMYSFVSICCKAIQEQQEMIEDLQNKIKEMESDK